MASQGFSLASTPLYIRVDSKSREEPQRKIPKLITFSLPNLVIGPKWKFRGGCTAIPTRTGLVPRDFPSHFWPLITRYTSVTYLAGSHRCWLGYTYPFRPSLARIEPLVWCHSLLFWSFICGLVARFRAQYTRLKQPWEGLHLHISDLKSGRISQLISAEFSFGSSRIWCGAYMLWGSVFISGLI